MKHEQIPFTVIGSDLWIQRFIIPGAPFSSGRPAAKGFPTFPHLRMEEEEAV